jgi:acyl CoA:acetate/3-ketoacid CoA transferase beta subunit
MEHTAKGEAKLLPRCTLPLTGEGVVHLLITDYGVFTFDGGLRLIEIASDLSVEQVRAATAANFTVAEPLRRLSVN